MVAQISLASAVLIATFSEAILYGVYVVMFVIAMFILLTKKRTNANMWLTAITVFMFLLSSAHIVVVLQYANTSYLEKDAAREGETVLQRKGDPIVYVPIVIEIINFYIADAIVFWRAWVLWGRTWRALAVPLVLWLGSVAGGIGFVNVLTDKGPPSPPATSKTSNSVTTWTVVFSTTTCISNFWAIGMIGYRYYIYQKEVTAVLGRRKASYRTLLILIIESGLLYCFSLLLFVVLFLSADRGTYLVLFHMLAQLTAIYPTMIIVVVCLRLTQQDNIEKFYSSVRFARLSAAFSSGLRTGREPVPTIEISTACSSDMRDTKDVEGADATTELIELDHVHSVHESYIASA